jgi:hypothetical protein
VARQERRVQGLLRAGGRRAAETKVAPSAGGAAAAAKTAPLPPSSGQLKEVPDNVRVAFELFDVNKSGAIDAAELRQACGPNANREPRTA